MNQKQFVMSNQPFPDKAGVIMFPPLLYVIFMALGLTASYFFPYPILPPTVRLLGWLFVAVGLVVVVSAVVQLNKHHTTVNPSGVTTAIVQKGIFQYSRNPMYVSFTLTYLGIMLLNNAWLGFLLLIPLLFIVQKGIIEREENYLTRKFGEEYLQYQSIVRRWF
jgi:protein-S-isoprenylcysteine O-methyltransferase Ste14